MIWLLLLQLCPLIAAWRLPRYRRDFLIGAAVFYVFILIWLSIRFQVDPTIVTKSNAATWVFLGVVGFGTYGYRRFLRWIKSRIPANDADASGPFSDAELDRYARHIVMHDIGGAGQKQIKSARVLVIGAGGLGSSVLQYLAASGVGELGIVDDDIVSLSNLQRQVIHHTGTIGQPKVTSAATRIQQINPHVAVRAYECRITAENAKSLCEGYDLIIDGSDSFATRCVVNAASREMGVPLISGAMSSWEGQIMLLNSGPDAPCYRCVFPDAPDPDLAPSCAQAGVIAPLPGVVGSMMALEALKWITGAGQGLGARMMMIDGMGADVRVLGVKKRADCCACG